MKVTGMILDTGAMEKAMQSRDMMEKAVWSAVWEINKAMIDAASAQGTRERREGEESTAPEPEQVVREARRTEETDAVANDREMEAAAVEDAVLEESMDKLVDVERRFAGRMTGRGLRLRSELMMMERWIAVASRWREEQQRMLSAKDTTAQKSGAAGEGGESSDEDGSIRCGEENRRGENEGGSTRRMRCCSEKSRRRAFLVRQGGGHSDVHDGRVRNISVGDAREMSAAASNAS